jgi:hypothetical protein
MNAVICTDGYISRELKALDVPDMKGLELASKVSTAAYFMVMKCYLQSFCFRFGN